MALFYHCPCGQSLRADEGQAGTFTRCLACGSLVRIPSLDRINHAIGIDTPADCVVPSPLPRPAVPPMPALELKAIEISSSTFEPRPSHPEIYSLTDAPDDGEDPQKAADRRRVRLALGAAEREYAARQRQASSWKLESIWIECLVYPLRAGPMLFGLAVAWATMIAILAAIMPADWSAVEIVAHAPLLLILTLLVGFTVACLEATIAAGAAGQAGYVALPGKDLAWAAGAALRSFMCFVAGPIIPVGVAFYFWLESGDLEFFDYLILWELGLVAVAYWMLALLSMRQRVSFRRVGPCAIVQFIKKRGFRVPLAALLAAIVVVGQGWFMLVAVEELHRGISGWVWLVGLWTGLLFVLVFLFRWLGVSWFHARQKKGKSESTEADLRGQKDTGSGAKRLSAGLAS